MGSKNTPNGPFYKALPRLNHCHTIKLFAILAASLIFPKFESSKSKLLYICTPVGDQPNLVEKQTW
jgi:hypothetical protein